MKNAINFNIKFLKSEYTKIIIGIIWGFGLACIFRCACEGRKCIIYKAPNPIDVKNKVYNFKDKCYTFKTVTTPCTDDAIE